MVRRAVDDIIEVRLHPDRLEPASLRKPSGFFRLLRSGVRRSGSTGRSNLCLRLAFALVVLLSRASEGRTLPT